MFWLMIMIILVDVYVPIGEAVEEDLVVVLIKIILYQVGEFNNKPLGYFKMIMFVPHCMYFSFLWMRWSRDGPVFPESFLQSIHPRRGAGCC